MEVEQENINIEVHGLPPEGRKRKKGVRNTVDYKRSTAKHARAKGKEYMNRSGNLVPKRELKDNCR